MNELSSFLLSVIESSNDAIIGLSGEGRVFSWNEGAEQMYGYHFAEVLGRPISVLALPERGDEIALMQHRVLRGERVRHFQTIHLRKDGTQFPVSLSVSPVINQLGRVLGSSVIARDLSPQLIFKESLREAEERYQKLFCAEPDATILLDAKTLRILDFNPACMTLYGYPKEEFCRMQFQDLLASPDPTEQKGAPTGSSLHKKSDGTIFPAEVSTGTFQWKGHKALVCIIRDISERIYTQQLRHSLLLARNIQEKLLPALEHNVPGLDLHAKTLYSDEIGGDYYDFFLPEGGSRDFLGVALGDVSGHGIGAALLMAMAKGALLSEVQHHGFDLVRIIVSMNRFFVRNSDESSFMTLFLAVIDVPNKLLNWCSAGQAPVYIYHNEGQTFEELRSTGIPLGIMDATVYSSLHTRLKEGDILLIATDGLWEAKNRKGEMFSIERVRQVLASWWSKSAQELCDLLLSKVQRFAGKGQLDDDTSLMIIKIESSP